MRELKLGTTYTPDAAMSLAIDLARLGANRVSPNPMVGCVVLDKSYQLLSYGYHKKYGQAHAEVDALEGLKKDDLEGSHLFVTLEPCSHKGKTSPCTEYLISLPIESITYGLEDPNPLVSGKGAQALKDAGKKVFLYDKRKEELNELLDSFLFHLNNKRPFVTLKVAASLDGMIRDANNKSKWITDKVARDFAHGLRSRYQAILVGKNTLVQDNPQLNIRHPDFLDCQNKVIIFNASGDLVSAIQDYKAYQIRAPEDLFIVCDKSLKKDLPLENITNDLYFHKENRVHIILVDFSMNDFFKPLSEILYAQGIYDILVEGGSKTASYFLQNALFDRLHLYQACKIMGSNNGLNWTDTINSDLDNAINLKHIASKNIGNTIFSVFKR